MPIDYTHQLVRWTDEQGCDHHATIVSHIRDGATSTVWMAMENKLEGQAAEWVVKIPLPSQINNHADEFEPEEEVVEKITAQYQKVGKKAPLPEMAKTQVMDLPAIVMKFYSVENQAILVRQQPDFVKWNYAHFALDSVAIFQTCYEIGLINTDIKEENFYWYEPGGLLVLDWNRCQRLEKFKDQGESGRREMIRLLVEILYMVYTGKDIPRPLPAGVDITWSGPQTPRSLRRLVLDANQGHRLTTFAALRERVDWMVKTISWEVGDLPIVISYCKTLQEDQKTPVLSRAESILDLVDTFLPFASGTQREDLLSSQSWARSRMIAQGIRLEEGCAEIKTALEKVDSQRAIQRCEVLLTELDLPAREKWKLGRWYLIAQCINDLRRQGSLTIIQQGEEKAAHIIEFLKPNGAQSHPITGVASELQASVLSTYKRIQDVDALLQKAEKLSYLSSIDADNQLLLWQEIQQTLNAPLGDLPRQVKEIIYLAMPVVDESVLSRQIMLEKEKARNEQNTLELKQKVKAMLREGHALDAIYQHVTTQPVSLDLDLRALLTAVEAAQRGDWPEALSLTKTQQVQSFDALQQILAKLTPWLQQKAKSVLYMVDMQQLKRVFDELNGLRVPTESPTQSLSNSLQSRLAVLTLCDPYSLDWYLACKENHLEPELLSASDETNQPVDWHIIRLTLDQKRAQLDQTIREVKQSMEKLNEMVDLQDLNRRIDDAIRLSKDLINNMNVQNQDLLNTRVTIAEGENNLTDQVQKLTKELDQLKGRTIQLINPNTPEGSLQKQVEAIRTSIQSVGGFIHQMEEAMGNLREHQEAMSGVVDVATLVHLVVDLSMKKQWLPAQSFVSTMLKRMDPGSYSANILQGWKNNLDVISRDESIKRLYEQWIDALQKGASQKVNGNNSRAEIESARKGAENMMLKLAETQQGLPLFEWLSQANHDLFNAWKKEDKSVEWYARFQSGDVETVRKEVQEAAKDGMRLELQFWYERISQFDWAINILENKMEDSHYGILMRTSIPEDVWSVAKRNFIAGYRAKDRGKAK